MDFSDAVRGLKQGHMIKRESWERGALVVIALGVSSPLLAAMAKNPNEIEGLPETEEPCAFYRTVDDVKVWSPSTADMLAEDWEVVELD